MRAPMVIRWPGVIKPGTVKNDIFASLDWLPTLVEIAGGPKGNALKKPDRGGPVSGHRQDHARWREPDRLSEGKAQKSARDTFFYYSGKDPSAVRYKNWKMYFAMVSDAPAGFIVGVIPYHWTQVVNIKRDPFETSIGSQYKTLMGMGGAISSPSTAYHIRLEHAPHRPGAVAEGARDLHRRSRRCRTRPATTWSRSCSRSKT